MKHPLLDLLSSSLIPELGADVSAGTSGNVHLVLITVSALRALPYQLAVVLDDLYLAVVAAYLAVVALGVELGIHDIVIDKSDDLHYRRNVVEHIWHLNIADSSSGRKRLELGFKLQLCESVHRLGNVNVIAVCDVILIGNALYYAKALLEALGKLVGGGFERSSVDTVLPIRL